MKMTRVSAAASWRFMVASFLAVGLVLAGSIPARADRDDRPGREESRYEKRHEGKHDRRDDRWDRKVTVVRELPRGYRTVVVNKVRYYEHDHRYYTKASDGYLLVSPPVGAFVATLPLGSVSLTIGGNFFFRDGDVYYRRANRGYAVVAAPLPTASRHSEAVTVWTKALNVRSGPGEHFPVVERAWRGETLVVSGHAPGWYCVRLPNGAAGWVMSNYTRPLAAG